jgi:metallo-beta-lactamase family protein
LVPLVVKKFEGDVKMSDAKSVALSRDLTLSFLGAARQVTGSRYLLRVGTKNILIDYGMFQGSKATKALNNHSLLPIDGPRIDAVILTHAHIDHSGLLPILCRTYNGPIYCTPDTKKLCGIMLPDSAHIQESDADSENRKGLRAGKKLVKPLYTMEDAYKCLEQFVEVPFGEFIPLFGDESIMFRCHPAEHIQGSATIEMPVTENRKKTNFVFSGDIGNKAHLTIQGKIEKTDLLIMESTYGNRPGKQKSNVELALELADVVLDTYDKGGNLVIPAFALGRTQFILFLLALATTILPKEKGEKLKNIRIFVDSPLTISATTIAKENIPGLTCFSDETASIEAFIDSHFNPFTMPNIQYTKTSAESICINDLKEPAIIISASGMCDAGRIRHHLRHNLWRHECVVLFVGYQAQGSLGRLLLEGAKTVKIFGEKIAVEAKIAIISEISAHANMTNLIKFFEVLNPDHTFLVHGEMDQIEPLEASIKKLHPEVSTYIPELGSVYSVEGGTVELLHTGYKISSTDDTEISTKGSVIKLDTLSNRDRKKLAKLRNQLNKGLSPEKLNMLKELELKDQGRQASNVITPTFNTPVPKLPDSNNEPLTPAPEKRKTTSSKASIFTQISKINAKIAQLNLLAANGNLTNIFDSIGTINGSIIELNKLINLGNLSSNDIAMAQQQLMMLSCNLNLAIANLSLSSLTQRA